MTFMLPLAPDTQGSLTFHSIFLSKTAFQERERSLSSPKLVLPMFAEIQSRLTRSCAAWRVKTPTHRPRDPALQRSLDDGRSERAPVC